MIKALLAVLVAGLAGGSAVAGTAQGAGPVCVQVPLGASLDVRSLPVQPSNIGAFVRGPKLNQGRYGQSATLLDDGRVLIAEGGTFNGQELHTGEVYDPVRNQFTETGPSFFSRTYIRDGAARLPDGRVLIVGGCGSAAHSASWFLTAYFCNGLRGAEIYDPT